MVRTCLRRERQVLKYNDLTDKQKFITEIVKDLDPQFDHPFYGRSAINLSKQLKSYGVQTEVINNEQRR